MPNLIVQPFENNYQLNVLNNEMKPVKVKEKYEIVIELGSTTLLVKTFILR